MRFIYFSFQVKNRKIATRLAAIKKHYGHALKIAQVEVWSIPFETKVRHLGNTNPTAATLRCFTYATASMDGGILFSRADVHFLAWTYEDAEAVEPDPGMTRPLSAPIAWQCILPQTNSPVLVCAPIITARVRIFWIKNCHADLAQQVRSHRGLL